MRRIRKKMATLSHVEWRQFFPAADRVLANLNGQWMVVGLLVALFIDCTMMAFAEGPDAKRHVILACGTDLQVFGPMSCRDNDLSALDESAIEDILRELCNDGIGELLFKMFGDSAYNPSNVMETADSLPGRGFSSVRQLIESSYAEIKTLQLRG
jgi:hypothetical protein